MEDYLAKAQDVAARIVRKNRLNPGSKEVNKSSKQPEASAESTIPKSIQQVSKKDAKQQMYQKKKG